jgi:hypothetical protein
LGSRFVLWSAVCGYSSASQPRFTSKEYLVKNI